MLVVVALMLLIWLPVQKQQLKPKPTTQQGQQLPSASVPAPTPIQPQPESAPQQKSSNAQSSESLCDRLTDSLISNWPLVGIGLLGIGVAWLTLKDIHTQAEETAKATQAMRDSIPFQQQAAESTAKAANAARDNAEAVMRGERAWLLIGGVDAKPDFLEQELPPFTYQVVNYGKTPGFMLSANAYLQIESGTNFTDDHAFMDMGGMAEDATVIPNVEPLILYGNDIPASERQFLLLDADRDKLLDSPPRAYLWAVGSIHYHDVFRKVHHTPFAYWYDVTDMKFVRVRTPGYNKPA